MHVKFIASGNVVFDKSESLPNPCNKKAYQCCIMRRRRRGFVGDWAWFIDEPQAGRGLPLVGFHSHAHVQIEKRERRKNQAWFVKLFPAQVEEKEKSGLVYQTF